MIYSTAAVTNLPRPAGGFLRHIHNLNERRLSVGDDSEAKQTILLRLLIFKLSTETIHSSAVPQLRGRRGGGIWRVSVTALQLSCSYETQLIKEPFPPNKLFCQKLKFLGNVLFKVMAQRLSFHVGKL